ncbi:MAG: YfhO family protein [Lachnospiraceae bacterium]|nr:YfhO family protein [Lachnospiraceae bacterium]
MSKEWPDRRREEAVLRAASFLIPAAVVLIGYAVRGIAPFGDKTLAAIDGWGQYFPMLREARRAFRAGETYSLAAGFGFDLRAMSAYYTNSPLWILLYVLPWEVTPAGVHLVVCLRFGLAGLTFAAWTRALHPRMPAAGVCVLSAAYALSGYALAYINQFMWMDAVWLLPMAVLGIRRLAREGRWLLYAGALAFTIWSNFYIAYMVCIFSCLWFGLEMLSLPAELRGGENVWKRCLAFAGASLAAGTVCLPVLIPTARALSRTIAAGTSGAGEVRFYGTPWGFAGRLLPFMKPSLERNLPNIYCGLTAVALAGLELYRAVRTRSRRGLLLSGLALFLAVSMQCSLTDYVWHGFHFPHQLPMRQSFLLIFVMLTLAGRALAAIFRSESARRTARVLVLALILEVSANGVFFFAQRCVATTVSTSLLPQEEAYAELLSLREGEIFARTEQIPARDNGGMLRGFAGISDYSSLMSKAEYRFFVMMGGEIYAQNVSHRYTRSRVTDAMFAVRYLVSKEEAGAGQREIGQRDVWRLLENEEVLPAAYLVSPQILELQEGSEGFALQEEFFLRAAGLWPAEERMLDAEGNVIREEVFQEGLRRLRRGGARLVRERGKGGAAVLRGRLQSDGEGYLLMTFPYADATLYVDGKEAQTEPVLGYLARSAERIPAGAHEVEIRLK